MHVSWRHTASRDCGLASHSLFRAIRLLSGPVVQVDVLKMQYLWLCSKVSATVWHKVLLRLWPLTSFSFMLVINFRNAYEIDFLFMTLFSNDSSVFFCLVFGNLSGMGATWNKIQSVSKCFTDEVVSACSPLCFTGCECSKEAAKNGGMRLVKFKWRNIVIRRN